MKQVIKLLLELGPLVIFFLTNSYFGIFYATAAFMVVITVSLAVSWIMFRKLAAMPLVTCVFVLIFGGLTLYLQDETFIKIKPTIVNLIFAGILFSGLWFGRLFLKIVFDEAFHLSDNGWHILTVRWAGFFLFLALLNELVWRGADMYYIPDSETLQALLKTAKEGETVETLLKAAGEKATNFWVSFKTFGLMPITMVFAMSQIGIIQKYAVDPDNNGEAKVES